METLDLLGQLEQSFSKENVDIVTFAEDYRFCGKRLYPRQRLLLKLFFLEELTDEEERILDYWISGGSRGEEIEICPNIRERIKWCKENGYKHFREITLVGGRRCSKGFITGIALTKLVYDLLQIRDPHKYYGIDTDKEIVFPILAPAQDQAKQFQFSDFTNTIRNCNALGRNLKKLQELEFSVMTENDIRKEQRWARERKNMKMMRDISSIRARAMPTNARTLRGSTTFALVLDEYAHFMQGDNDQSDSEIYGAATPALAQFSTDAMIFCSSSPYSKIGKFYELYEEGMAVEDGVAVNPRMFTIKMPSWALFDGWWEDDTYEGPHKCVTVSPDWDPERKKEDGEYFYTKEDRQAILVERSEEQSDPVKFKVERRGNFSEVIDAYLDPVKVDRMFMGRPHWDPKAPTDEERLTYFPYNVNWNDSTYQYKYVGHIDPSSTTAGFGFALGHIEMFEIDGEINEHVVFDIIQRWDPKKFVGEAIEWEPILESLIEYVTIFRPAQLTFDQHQNRMPMEWLQKEIRNRGLGETRVFEKTADLRRNWNRAEIFRTALYHNLIHAPNDTADCEYAAQELKYLQEVQTARIPRVEKQESGPIQTKDCADAIMEVTETLIGNIFDKSEALAMPLGLGAQGGFGIGRGSRPEQLSGWYQQRNGEQAVSRGNREAPRDPARRPFGGRPIPRRLPRRGLPGY